MVEPLTSMKYLGGKLESEAWSTGASIDGCLFSSSKEVFVVPLLFLSDRLTAVLLGCWRYWMLMERGFIEEALEGDDDDGLVSSISFEFSFSTAVFSSTSENNQIVFLL